MKALFLDTNIFMHFRQVDEIDWTGMASADRVELVIAPVVYRQLDRYKDQKFERVRTALSKIRSLTRSGGQVRTNVRLVFLHEDPLIDYAAHRLDRQSEDDQLIVSMVQFRNESGVAEVVLVTDDFLLEQKARAQHFAVVRPDDSLRLRVETSAEDRERKRLRDENLRLLGRQPQLALRFASSAARQDVTLRRHSGWGEGARERQLKEMKSLYGPDSGIPSFGRISRRDYDQECEEYLDHVDTYARFQAQGAELTLDIDVNISTDAPVVVCESDSWEMRAPREPNPYALPLGLEPRMPHDLPLLSSLVSDVVTISIVNKGPAFVIHAKIRKVKARMREELGPFRIFFPSADLMGSFKMTYTINADGLPADLTGELHVVASKPQ
jgi:hypothetical protein